MATGPIPVSECVSPPADEIGPGDEGNLVLTPNPVAAGTEARLSLVLDNVPVGGTTEPELLWQCWDGSSWATTHYVFRGFEDATGQVPPTYEVASTTTLGDTVVLYMLGIPDEGNVIIPDVPPGTYRLRDEVQIPDFAPVVVIEYVEVGAPGS